MHDVRVCKYMFVYERGGQQVASRVPFLGSTLCKKSSWTPVECLKLFRMSYWPWWATPFAQGPPYSAPTSIPSPSTAEEKDRDPGRTRYLAQASQPTPASQTLLLPHQALNKVAAAERMVRRPSYLDLFRTPRLRYISLCCMVVW